jgi:hypothetical protein
VESLNIDILVITETWFDDGTSINIMKKSFGTEFIWYGHDKPEQKSWSGSGGIGILLRRNIGEISLIKVSKKSDIIWVKVTIHSFILFVAAVYFPHLNSNQNDKFADNLAELEADCLN